MGSRLNFFTHTLEAKKILALTKKGLPQMEEAMRLNWLAEGPAAAAEGGQQHPPPLTRAAPPTAALFFVSFLFLFLIQFLNRDSKIFLRRLILN